MKGLRLGVGICLALTGCTSGGASDGTFEYTVVPASTPVASLTDTQATDLCIAMVEHYDARLGADALVRAACLSIIVSDATTESECVERVPECEADLRTRSDFPTSCGVAITRVRTECDATVAQIETCIDDTTAMLENLLGGSCADAPTITPETGDASRYDGGSPPSCLALSAGCSELVLQSGRAP